MRGDTTHTHDKQETGINEANQLVRGMRKRARKELTPLPLIYEEERGKIITTDLGTSPAEVAGKLPFFSSLYYLNSDIQTTPFPYSPIS